MSKALLSAKKIVAAGNSVVFGADGNYIVDDTTGETMEVEQENGLCNLTAWVIASDF